MADRAKRTRPGSAARPRGAPRDGKPLVIVESPAKARTIERILGGAYTVRSSMGHVRDLPTSRFGVDIEHGFEPTYIPIRTRAKVLKDLKTALKSAPEVYLAPDPDREGEAIAWHLKEALRIPEERLRRVTFHEITPKAVEQAFLHPRGISMPLVDAQQARRILDRIVGYKLSPLLWKKVGRGLSAGRVQSVAVRLIVEREREIQNFQPEEYWRLTATVAPAKGGNAFAAELFEWRGRKAEPGSFLLRSRDEAEAARRDAEPGPWAVESVERRERTERAPAPFTTSLLQQQASIRLRYTAKRTMAIAQQLYEGVDIGTEGRVGLITYMRTDSYRVADDAVRACREWITRQYGADFVPPKPPVRAAGRLAQEAHEAIRPTDVRRTPESVRPYLTEEQFRLYRLIWRRFVASQMAPAKYEVTEVVVRSGETRFRAAGRILRFAGYTQVWPSSQKEQPLLPDLREGDELVLQSLEPTQHFTEPPPRYTEASLVKALEKYGIGRPSTYAPILSTIQERGYVRSEGRTLVPTELGMLVTDLLVRHFAGIVDTGFTAQMEKKLDRIEQARTGWREVLEEFYKVFAKDLERAQEEMKSARAEPAEGEPPCEACGRPMVWRWTTRGRFLACSGYPECRQRRVPAEELAGSPCPVCGAPMRIRRNRLGRYEACTKYPECKFSRPLEYRGRPIRVPEGWTETCPQSGHPMVLRLGRRGPFIACSGYPECKTTRNVPREWMRAGGDDQTQAT